MVQRSTVNSTTKVNGARALRESENLETMLRLFCHYNHRDGASLCPDCQRLLDYSKLHLETCRLGPKKPVCENCSFECFTPAFAHKIKAVIDATLPRMFLEHPQISLRHWADSLYHVQAGTVRQDYRCWGSE